MKLLYEPIKNQMFDIGRTINISKCNCEKCDFMNCPKNNYCIQTKRAKHPIVEFCELYKDKLLKINAVYFDKATKSLKRLSLSYFLIEELLGDCIEFPKDTYYAMGDVDEMKELFEETTYNSIYIQRLNSKGKVINCGSVHANGYVNDIDLSKAQLKLVNEIKTAIEKITIYIINEFIIIGNKNSDFRGWLNKDGQLFLTNLDNFTHYDFATQYCKEHNILEELISKTDDILIRKFGFVKITDYNWAKYGYDPCLTNYFSEEKEITQKQYDWLGKNKPQLLKKYVEWFYKGDK